MSNNPTDNRITRRSTLKQLGAGLIASTLLTTSAVGAGTATTEESAVQPTQDIPTFNPDDDDELVLENPTEGWSSEESSELLIENDSRGSLRPQGATTTARWTGAKRTG